MKSMDPECVAYWYFRLQGCTTITNFLIHDFQNRGKNHSDSDIVAVRFPYRHEDGMEIEETGSGGIFSDQLINLFLVEVKARNVPKPLNDSWTTKPATIKNLIERIGMFRDKVLPQVLEQIFNQGMYQDNQYCVQVVMLCKVGMEPALQPPLNRVLTWENEILPFIYRRFQRYSREKRDHSQWDDAGDKLYELATQATSQTSFVASVIALIEQWKMPNS